MKKKKIVAGLLSAAMVATSILPGGGFFQPLRASAASWESTPAQITLGDDNEGSIKGTITTGGITIDPEKVTLTQGSVVVSSQTVKLTVPILTGTSVGWDADKGLLLTASSIKKVAGTWGETTVDVVSGSSSVLARVKVIAKTNKLSIKGVPSYQHNGNVLKATEGTVYYVDSNGTTVDDTYVTGGSLTFKIRAITKAQAIMSESDLRSALGVRATSLSAPDVWTDSSITFSSSTKNQNYAIVALAEGLNGDITTAITTTEALSYKKTSGSSSSNSNNNNNSNNSNNNNNSSSNGGGGAAPGTTTTTTTTDPTTGTTTTTTDTTNADGSTVKETVVENADGSKTTTTVETAADGSVKETVVQENADGSKVETVSETQADGTTIQSKTETAADGSQKSTKLTRRPNGSAQKVISNIAANGASTVVTINESADGASEIINEVTDASGNTTAMAFSVAAGSNKVTLDTITTNAKTVKVPASLKIQAEVSLSKLSLKADTLSVEGKALKVTKIGKAALKGNKTATKLVIGKNVKSIGAQAFQGVSKLKTVNIKGNVTTIGKNSFKNINKKATIKIKATAKQYKAMVKKIKNAKKGNAPKKVTYKRVK